MKLSKDNILREPGFLIFIVAVVVVIVAVILNLNPRNLEIDSATRQLIYNLLLLGP